MEYFSIYFAAIVFAIIGVVHVCRLFVDFNFVIGNFHVPKIISGIVGVIALIVSYFLFMVVL